MAQEVRFKTLYHMVIEAGQTYTTKNMPTVPDGVTIDTMELIDATFLSGRTINTDGSLKVLDGKPAFGRTDIRGIRIRTDATGVEPSAEADSPNVPGVLQIGQQIIFDASYQYTCTEGYGVVALGEAL